MTVKLEDLEEMYFRTFEDRNGIMYRVNAQDHILCTHARKDFITVHRAFGHASVICQECGIVVDTITAYDYP